jgi:hypothetical protein
LERLDFRVSYGRILPAGNDHAPYINELSWLEVLWEDTFDMYTAGCILEEKQIPASIRIGNYALKVCDRVAFGLLLRQDADLIGGRDCPSLKADPRLTTRQQK